MPFLKSAKPHKCKLPVIGKHPVGKRWYCPTCKLIYELSEHRVDNYVSNLYWRSTEEVLIKPPNA